jgi:hypothetical protein
MPLMNKICIKSGTPLKGKLAHVRNCLFMTKMCTWHKSNRGRTKTLTDSTQRLNPEFVRIFFFPVAITPSLISKCFFYIIELVLVQTTEVLLAGRWAIINQS